MSDTTFYVRLLSAAACAAFLAVGAALLVGCAGERPILLERPSNSVAGATESSAVDASGLAPSSGESGVRSLSSIVEEESAATASVIVLETAIGEASADGNISEAPPGVNAMITPTGVVLPVIGQAAAGYLTTTPCGTAAIIRWGQPVGPVQVVVDPGHGGDERGAIGENGLAEATVNLQVARQVAAELTERGISVVLTRNADYRLPITERVALADALEAQAFVSIHHNSPAAVPSASPGTEVYVQSRSAEASRLGGLIHQQVTAGLDRFNVPWVARSDAGVLSVLNEDGEDAYGIIRRPSAPSALVEVAYLGNADEAELMESASYIESVGQAVAVAMEQYLTTDAGGTGQIPTPRVFNPSGETGGNEGCVDPPLG